LKPWSSLRASPAMRPADRAAGAPSGRANGSRCGQSSWSRSATITRPATGSATERAISDGGRTRNPSNARSTSSSASRARRSLPSYWSTDVASGTANEIALKGVRLTSPEKVLYPEQGVSKRELADYYCTIADDILPHVARRPISLVRCPDGRQRQCFF